MPRRTLRSLSFAAGLASSLASAQASLAQSEDAGVAVALEPEAAIDITVVGVRPAPAPASYTRSEARLIPGAFGDPFRATEAMPGVTPIASGLPFFYLRGAPPGNVGYLLDGVAVPYLYHVGVGPSVLHPALIAGVDLHSGAPPARFGRFTGGVLSATTVEPSPEWRGEAALRLFDVGGLVETGFAAGRGSALLGGRYSYTAALLSLAAPEWDLDYHDFQARIAYDLTDRDRLSLFAFGAYDYLAEDHDGRPDVLFASEFYRSDLRYDRSFDRGNLRAAITLGYGRTPAAMLVPDDPRNIAAYTLGGRTELEHDLGDRVRVRAGLDVTTETYRWQGRGYADPDSPAARQLAWLDRPRTDFATGAYVELAIELGDALELLPSLRADLYGSGTETAWGVDPRIRARAELVPGFRAIGAVGLAHQAPTFILPLPGVVPELGSGLQRAIQASAGFELDVASVASFGASAFYAAFSDMTDAFDRTGGDTSHPTFQLRSDGTASGLEVSIRRRLTQSVGGFVSYTWSRATREVGARTFVGAFDRPHVLNAAVSCELGRGWRAGGRLAYYSGTPKQPHWESAGDAEPEARATRIDRHDSFVRLDLRLEKRWSLAASGWIAFVLEFMNATLSKDVWPDGEKVGPISVPSVGVEAGF